VDRAALARVQRYHLGRYFLHQIGRHSQPAHRLRRIRKGAGGWGWAGGWGPFLRSTLRVGSHTELEPPQPVDPSPSRPEPIVISPVTAGDPHHQTPAQGARHLRYAFAQIASSDASLWNRRAPPNGYLSETSGRKFFAPTGWTTSS